MTQQTPKSGDVIVMVGTRKGAFLFWSDAARKRWRRAAHHPGWMVHHMAYDAQDSSLYAATNSEVFGGLVQRSTDLGGSWSQENSGLDYPGDSEHRVRKVWHLTPAGAAGEIYGGVERAGLFRSQDGGRSWQPLKGLNEHVTNTQWAPGGGGLILHTILVDPQDRRRIYAAISAGGLYRSDDGGETWAPKNMGVRADFMPERYPEVGQCVHKVALHPDRPATLFQQNHCGMYRSDDYGDSWVDIGAYLPSTFGFPCVVHAHDPDTVYFVPLMRDDLRLVPQGQMSVWRSRDRGESWQPLTSGLPQNAYLSVLREGLAVDPIDPCGVYVGTQTGQVFHSADEGEHWELLADYLPPVYSVSAAQVV